MNENTRAKVVSYFARALPVDGDRPDIGGLLCASYEVPKEQTITATFQRKTRTRKLRVLSFEQRTDGDYILAQADFSNLDGKRTYTPRASLNSVEDLIDLDDGRDWSHTFAVAAEVVVPVVETPAPERFAPHRLDPPLPEEDDEEDDPLAGLLSDNDWPFSYSAEEEISLMDEDLAELRASYSSLDL